MSASLRKTRFMAYTAVLIALLLGLQFVTKAFGQLVTGSCVNLVLAVSVMCCGLASGLTVAILSPLFAFLLGIGPGFVQVVPFIALGNAVYVLLISLISKKAAEGGIMARLASIVPASLCKFLTLYLLVAKLVVPTLGLPEGKLSVVAASFSWPQLVTALVGGLLALEVAPLVKKAMK